MAAVTVDVAAVRAGLADVLRAGCPDWNVSDYITDGPVPPLLAVSFPTNLEYHKTQTGRILIQWPVTIVTGAVDATQSQALMDIALGTGTDSVVAVLDDASNNAWFKCLVKTAGDMRGTTVGGAVYLTCDINLEILA